MGLKTATCSESVFDGLLPEHRMHFVGPSVDLIQYYGGATCLKPLVTHSPILGLPMNQKLPPVPDQYVLDCRKVDPSFCFRLPNSLAPLIQPL
ncbi:hypothetical protein PAXRUDRAFT_653576 [Paxillus rubicundulus Ve08.2h10]|uniref:Uncharacterized protein n=1 Tax=Paxillus rubicundulus Ve08.2h10 TaxID=930991 RepID=A0A0D0DJP7_9AGAM|nr:hypothetical protein PAXRUDRAFT_653576 [Paxillus rubicundulus Ve08.2h10]